MSLSTVVYRAQSFTFNMLNATVSKTKKGNQQRQQTWAVKTEDAPFITQLDGAGGRLLLTNVLPAVLVWGETAAHPSLRYMRRNTAYVFDPNDVGNFVGRVVNIQGLISFFRTR